MPCQRRQRRRRRRRQPVLAHLHASLPHAACRLLPAPALATFEHGATPVEAGADLACGDPTSTTTYHTTLVPPRIVPQAVLPHRRHPGACRAQVQPHDGAGVPGGRCACPPPLTSTVCSPVKASGVKAPFGVLLRHNADDSFALCFTNGTCAASWGPAVTTAALPSLPCAAAPAVHRRPPPCPRCLPPCRRQRSACGAVCKGWGAAAARPRP